ncbi:uncharacterized protein BDZ99DRAFT_119459 [Mytilinidion resinicola]|uniref:Uncharacterized protein n=1 Tax=Mytilinidion resinicola TaxID=574789 RepID=A0A6A6Z5S9_9PEZI|nr:uncharacterized protein BDZ99DRAFT_119459 [Mytilinidion resinicola]KAF2815617.1 hypothetical protein BDZ99DRAFT_119459 [Mytilinidion resinicola]
MVANEGRDGDAPPPHHAFLCEKTFTTIVKHGEVILNQLHDRSDHTLQKAYIRRVQSVVWGRKLTKTARFLALVPKDTKEKGIIAIVFGASVPVVQRKRGEQFGFIGECYALGAMAGEAFDIRNQLREPGIRES